MLFFHYLLLFNSLKILTTDRSVTFKPKYSKEEDKYCDIKRLMQQTLSPLKIN